MTQKTNILIIDDIPQNVQVSGNILKEKNYNIMAALNGETGLKILDERAVDLVLLDVSMPGMNGHEVCEQILGNEKTKDIPVIFLTARSESEDIVKGFKLGAVDYITKPFNPDELLQRVENHLKIKQQKEQIAEQNRKLAIQNKELCELNKSKNKFLSIIAHDLKSPFNAVLGLMNLLEKKFSTYSDEKKFTIISNVNSNLKNTFSLLENLLTWARSQSNRIELNIVKNDLKFLVEEVFFYQAKAADVKHVKLTSLIKKDTSAFFDRKSIETVLRNLISNAIKFSKENTEIKVNAVPKSINNKQYIQVKVCDSGIGIEPESIDKLFSIEENISTEGTNQEQGTGLGLLICKEFVEKNKGEIFVESELGKGSTFSFTLPA